MFNGRKRLATALSASCARRRDRLRAVVAGAGRARHRRRRRLASTASTTRPSRPRSATTTPSSSSTELRKRPRRRSRPTRTARTTGSTSVREQVQDSVVRQYEGQSLSAVGQVVVSDDPGSFLSQLSTMSAYNDLQAQLFADYATEPKALDIRRDATAHRAAEIAELEEQLAAEKATIDDKLAEAKDLLDELEAEEREALLASRGSDVRLPSNVPASGRAAAAVSYALAQVGDSYVYGAAGPERLRLLRPDDDGLGPGRRRAAALLQRPVRLRPARRRPATCSPATWSSTTARSATSASTSATA